MRPECDRCVFRFWPVRCHASTSGHSRYCQLIHDHGRADYAAIVEARTLGSTSPAASASDRLAGPGEPIPAPPPERPDHLAWKVLILECDYRGADAESCGCARLHYCLMGKGRKAEGMSVGTVSLADCHACVTSTDPNVTTQ